MMSIIYDVTGGLSVLFLITNVVVQYKLIKTIRKVKDSSCIRCKNNCIRILDRGSLNMVKL